MADEQPRNLVPGTTIAKICGLSLRRIQQLTSDGIIETVQDPNGGHRKYDLLPTIMKYIHYLQEVASGRAQKEHEAELKGQKLKAEIELKESQGELHKLRTAIAAGRYIAIEEVQLDYRKFFVVFKRFALSIPSRVGGIIGNTIDPVASRQIERDLVNDINSMLETFVVSARSVSSHKEEEEQSEENPAEV